MKSNVESKYRYHDSFKIYQGDIFRDVNLIIEYSNDGNKEFLMPYIIILSQDCDLNEDYNSYNEYLVMNDELDLLEIEFDESTKKVSKEVKSMYDKLIPSVLVCPAFPAEQLRNGIHLKNFNNFAMQYLNSNMWSRVTSNQDVRYHYLDGCIDFQIPELVVDFKRYYTVPTSYLYSIFKKSYVGSLNELYRERFSQRFVNYLSRIGLP